MRRTILALFLITQLSALAVEEMPRTINTTGEAMVCVAPDEVVVNVGVEIFDAGLDHAKTQNDTACRQLLKAIKELGIDEKDIKTDALNVELAYHDSGKPSKGIEGYYVRRGYEVTLKDTKLFEGLIDTALKNGANKLMGFEYRTTELRKHRDEARKKAIHAAKEKCEALAAELGCKLGQPRTISDSSYGYYGAYRSWWGWGGGYGQYQAQNSISYAGNAGSGGETLPLGQIGVNAQVTVVFDLIPEK
jgi:uncharacterized protein YggE